MGHREIKREVFSRGIGGGGRVSQWETEGNKEREREMS